MYETASIHDRRASVIPQYSDDSALINGMSNMSLYPKNYQKTTYPQNSRLINNASSNSQPIATTNPENIRDSQHSIYSNQTQPFRNSALVTQRSSTSSLESASSVPMMPMNVKGMLLHGLPSDEVLRNWLASIKCEEHIENFMYHGYDIHLVTRMTPQDLAAIGCKSPALRKKLLSEIRKLNLEYELPNHEPNMDLEKWLGFLKLSQYHAMLVREGYETIDKVCKLTWEDLEEIGIVKLGHQKRLLLGIERMEKAARQLEESQNDNPIYDVHPNHRVSLNGSGSSSENRTGTIGRVRSGLFQTRSGANLDHRGLPVATVMPALKHVNGSLLQVDNSQQAMMLQTNDGLKSSLGSHVTQVSAEQIYDCRPRSEAMKLTDLSATMKRNHPPLPPTRTNSLKVQGNGSDMQQAVYGGAHGCAQDLSRIYGFQPSNSTSFLRTPKLGTLTATTNKMLASGGHIQTLPSNSVAGPRIVPVREAPLPPNQQQLPYQPNPLIQSSIPEKIDEESSSTIGGLQNQSNFPPAPPPPPDCDGPNASFINSTIGNHLADANEFPPPPPCEP